MDSWWSPVTLLVGTEMGGQEGNKGFQPFLQQGGGEVSVPQPYTGGKAPFWEQTPN